MGMDFTPGKTPAGKPLLYIRTFGNVSGDDAARLEKLLGTGGPYHGMPMLCHVEKDAEFSVEARQGFASMGDNGPNMPVAVIMASAPLRMIINFIVKAGNLKRDKPTNLKFFNAEPEGMKWIDEELQRLT